MIKKAVKILLAAIAGSAALVLWKTFTFTSPLADVKPSEEPINWKIDESNAVRKLSQALTYPTISHKREMMDLEAYDGFLQFLFHSFPNVFSKLQIDTVNDYTLLITWRGRDTTLAPAMLMGHYDVVPVESATLDQWEEAPFSGRISDGYIYGRGAIDNKTPCIAILEAVENLLSYGIEPKRTLLISIGHDEEIGGNDGAVKVVEKLSQKRIEPAIILDEGGTMGLGLVPGLMAPTALIGTAEKGYLSLELLVKGSGGHSSMPGPDNTLSILSRAMHRLNENPFPFELSKPVEGFLECAGPYMDFPARMAFANKWLFKKLIFNSFSKTPQGAAMMRTTQVPTVVAAGVKDNVIPNVAKAVYNFRLLPGHIDSSVIKRVIKIINDPRVTVRMHPDAPYTPGSPSSPHSDHIFRQLVSVIKTTFPEAVVSPYLVLGATDSRHFYQVCTHVYRFNPILLKPDDLSRIHGINERVSISDFLRAIDFYAQWIQDLCVRDVLSASIQKSSKM
jgi:carboxypeptidase PM20D1